MIKLKYSQFMGFPFSQSVQKLNSQNFPAKVAYQMKCLGEKMQAWREKISKEYMAIVDKYATKDADGKVIHPNPEDKNGFDIKPELMDAYKKDEAAFGETEFTINVSQIQLEDLAKLEFTPAEMAQLSPLIATPLGLVEAAAPVASVTQLPTSGVPAAETSEGSAS